MVARAQAEAAAEAEVAHALEAGEDRPDVTADAIPVPAGTEEAAGAAKAGETKTVPVEAGETETVPAAESETDGRKEEDTHGGDCH